MEAGSFLLLLAAGIVGYVLLGLLRVILFPRKPVVIEYTPRQASPGLCWLVALSPGGLPPPPADRRSPSSPRHPALCSWAT